MKNFKLILYTTFFVLNIFPNCTNLIANYQHHFNNAQAVIGRIRGILNQLPLLNRIPTHHWEGILRRIVQNGGIHFCPNDERQCFVNFVTRHENFSGFVDKVRACQPTSRITPRDIRTRPGELAQAVMLDYLTGNRTCAPLVRDYIRFAKGTSNCKGRIIVDQCPVIFGQSCEEASETIRAAFRALGLLNTVLGQIMQIADQAWSAIQQAWNEVSRFGQQVGRVAQQVGHAIARAFTPPPRRPGRGS
jgi:hypothetical protein